jgi:hypothetical protein
LRTSPKIRPSSLFSVWSARMLSDRSSESPLLIITANCRLNTARSLSLTLGFMPGIEISLFMPVLAWVMLNGARPRPLSLVATCAWSQRRACPS